MYRGLQASILILENYLKFRKILFSFLLIVYVIGYKFQVESLFNIYVAEIVSIASFFYIIYNLKIDSRLKSIIFSYLIIFVGLCISDFINNSIFANYSRGLANIIVATTNLLFMYYIFYLDTRFLFLFLFSIIFRLLFIDIDYSVFSTFIDNKNLLKVYFLESYSAFILLILFFIEKKLKNFLNITLIIITLFTIFILNFRGLGLLFLISFAIVNFNFKKNKLSKALILLSFIYALYCGYIILIQHFEINGSTFSALNKVENIFNPIDFLIITRTDFFVALNAIFERPIIGWGSWAFDTYGIYESLFVQMRGYSEYDGSFIPAHSVILTTWLWGGFFGLLGGLFLFINIIKISKSICYYPPGYRVVATILMVGLIFDFFFSPIGALRISYPSTIALILVLNNMTLKNQIEK